MDLVMREWETGEVLNRYKLNKYEEQWGNVYNMFHRRDMHATLLDAATSSKGRGVPCTVYIDYASVFPRCTFLSCTDPYLLIRCRSVDTERRTLTFTNGKTITADLIIGADGIRVRRKTPV
jgi:salicylate hydroxylase